LKNQVLSVVSDRIKIGVFALWRNSESYIDKTLLQLDELIETFTNYEFSFFFYENDSTDSTVQILSDWKGGKDAHLLSETLNTKHYGSVMSYARMQLLAQYRNKCKALADGREFDFALVFDSDVKFTYENFSHALAFLNQNPDYVMVTPNVRQPIEDMVFDNAADSYYDAGCLRDKYGNETLYCSDCPLKRIEDRMLWNLNLPVEINAGFGGFALIRWKPFSKVHWSADINIEHVNFCYDLKQYGKIAILPYSKVYVSLDLPDGYVSSVRPNMEKQTYEL
jgi:hypothetical protein